MRKAAVILVSIAGGFACATICAGISFLLLFAASRALTWMTGDENYMWIMLSGMVICPVTAFGGFFGGAFVFANLGQRWMQTAELQGFDVVRTELEKGAMKTEADD